MFGRSAVNFCSNLQLCLGQLNILQGSSTEYEFKQRLWRWLIDVSSLPHDNPDALAVKLFEPDKPLDLYLSLQLESTASSFVRDNPHSLTERICVLIWTLAVVEISAPPVNLETRRGIPAVFQQYSSDRHENGSAEYSSVGRTSKTETTISSTTTALPTWA